MWAAEGRVIGLCVIQAVPPRRGELFVYLFIPVSHTEKAFEGMTVMR